MVWTTRSAEELEAFGARLVAEVGAIRRREFAPRAGTACRWCEYRAACPGCRTIGDVTHIPEARIMTSDQPGPWTGTPSMPPR